MNDGVTHWSGQAAGIDGGNPLAVASKRESCDSCAHCPSRCPFIDSEAAYPRTAVQAVELGVTAGPMQAPIGVLGKEDLFMITVISDGRHVIQTGG